MANTRREEGWVLEARALRKKEPKGILFLCVANSARSQMAEGIARKMAPEGVKVWSAGSNPTQVRREAKVVLKEVGIDISHHRSKAVTELSQKEVGAVDTVITLCEQEVCPVFLGDATRVHWALPDPVAVAVAADENETRASGDSDEASLASFRRTRDELIRRLTVLFGRS